MPNPKIIALSAGEPAGVGPDIIIALAQSAHPCELVVFASRALLEERAQQLKLPLHLSDWHSRRATPQAAGTLHIVDVPLQATVVPGQLNPQNSAYVITCLNAAIDACIQKKTDALVTAPIHKSIINEAGIPFSGHTEHLATRCKVDKTVMFFASPTIHLALQTTHLPLKDVSNAITEKALIQTLTILHDALRTSFNIPNPHICVLGLNPHAGENGHLGDEEITIIAPAIDACRKKGYAITGPLPADTAFINNTADCILSMYHDQALPLLKSRHFREAVNITLGLPIIRTSVDHGTALDLAGTNKAHAENICYALEMALTLAR